MYETVAVERKRLNMTSQHAECVRGKWEVHFTMANAHIEPSMA